MNQQDPTARAVASARTPGFDVARALAILGMILVNFAAWSEETDGPAAAEWFIQQIEGKAAALFVTLAGVGVSLRVAAAERRGLDLGSEQRALLRRALVLFALGLVHQHFWAWDILHMYGVFLLAAALLLRASSALLIALAAGLIALSVPLQLRFDYLAEPDFWTLSGALSKMMFNGLFPVVPWLSFLFVGIVLGRLDLKDERTRRSLIAAFVPLLVAVEVIDYWADLATMGPPPHTRWATFAMAWPRPPTPGFAITGIVYATLVICLVIEVTEPRPGQRWVMALTATGQLALSVYVAHAMAITIALDHEHFIGGTLTPVLSFGLVFYAAAVMFAWRWRARWPYGPLELIVRQLGSASPAAPWGGAPLAPGDSARSEEESS